MFINLENLLYCGWYWGFFRCVEVIRKLEGKFDGLFFVCDSFYELYLYSVIFRMKGRILYIRIMYDGGCFGFVGSFGFFLLLNFVVLFVDRVMKIFLKGLWYVLLLVFCWFLYLI